MVVVVKTQDAYPMCEFKFKMKMTVKEVDEEGNVDDEYDDEYQIDPVKIKISDLM